MNEQQQFYRDTWAEVDLDALYDNIKGIISSLPAQTSLFAAVKANAYGHGDYQVAKTALQAGADGLVVALLDEALALRKKGIRAPILVLGAVRPQDAGIAARYRISLPVFQIDWIKEAGKWIADEDSLAVHIKCDTGMGRIGLKSIDELKQIDSFIEQNDKFILEGIFTHFSTADEREENYYQQQLASFKRYVSSLKSSPRYIHAANSAAALCHNDSMFNMVRVGIAMYGLNPSEERELPFQRKQILSLHTKIVHIKKVKAGDSIGYGAQYKAEEDEWIATIPIGYADGWLRHLEGQRVIAGGREAVIVGRICMDQTMIRLPDYLPVGTDVTLIGKQGSHFISVEEIADQLSTINYEVTCTINFRVPRLYKWENKIIEVENNVLVDKI